MSDFAVRATGSFDWKRREIPSKHTYKLAPIRRALFRVGSPHLGRKTILVAGTNGKGSVVQYLNHLFSACASRTGMYTSPHVTERRERIRIGRRMISEALLRRYERHHAEVLEPLSYFERLTVVAFLIFRDRECDIQILEVGMGGRLDATNTSQPDISVITSIDYDHQAILGSTLTKIAREKAGIMRRGRRVFVSRQHPEVRRELKRCAAAKGAHLKEVPNFAFIPERAMPTLLKKVFRQIARERGTHQSQNASLAYAVFREAQAMWNYSISDVACARALQQDLLPARIQIIQRRPLHIVDGAHNSDSLQALIQFLRQRHPLKKFALVFGAMDDKDLPSMVEALAPWSSRVYLPWFYRQRQAHPSTLATYFRRRGLPVAGEGGCLGPLIPNLKGPTLVVGSLYLAGAFLRAHKRVKRVI